MNEYMGKPDDMVHILSGIDILQIVVCGNPEKNRTMTLDGGQNRPDSKLKKGQKNA